MRENSPNPSWAFDPFDAEYERLRRIARGLINRKAWDEHSMGPTDLVHEALARVLRDPGVRGHADRRYIFASIMKAMGRILSERVRARKRLKRGGDWSRVRLDDVVDYVESQRLDVLDLTEAIERLADKAPRPAEAIAFRCYFLMTTRDISEALQVSTSTVEVDLAYARAWLRRELEVPEKPCPD